MVELLLLALTEFIEGILAQYATYFYWSRASTQFGRAWF